MDPTCSKVPGCIQRKTVYFRLCGCQMVIVTAVASFWRRIRISFSSKMEIECSLCCHTCWVINCTCLQLSARWGRIGKIHRGTLQILWPFQVKGPSRSLKMSPFDRAHNMTSYWRSIYSVSVFHYGPSIFLGVPHFMVPPIFLLCPEIVLVDSECEPYTVYLQRLWR